MRQKFSQIMNLKNLTVFVCIFFIFFFSAREDRLYKKWKAAYGELFTAYVSLKQVAQVVLSPEEKILIDNSELKKWKSPFRSRILGRGRHLLYSHLSPRLKDESTQLNPEDSELLIEERSKKGTFESYRAVPQAEMVALDKNDLKRLRQFMKKNNVQFFILYYTNWWQKKSDLASAGFKILQSNKHFMLCTLKKSD